MHSHDLKLWQHAHDFGRAADRHAERRTRWVVALTFGTMLVELAAGWLTGSMALMADAWHMASHVGALGLAAFAYGFARRHAGDVRFTFGTGKVSALAGYSSALLLGLVAFWMALESFHRLLDPVPVRYAEAMAVAVLGLAVNLLSAWLLEHEEGDHHDLDHRHGHHDHHHGEHVDHNLKAAYVHVLADALTSVTAIVALAGGMAYGWTFLDPLMGIVGAVVVARWAWGLAHDSAAVLLDAEDHGETSAEIHHLMASEPDHEIADLHLWRVGPASRACILSLVTHSPKPADYYRARLSGIAGLDHITVEINQCRDERCRAGQA
ncbi:cation transporter [Parasulfuritortus cantonensis]|uniref:Cation transporter n=1 Tax=Parasulfuritortus cantonensis TaxID=2528202 RepID=A0A4R1BEH5_9PROT|nr:CDF family Co(II)/Ni(II) efflux transporter DmeF [Parasulfuritortus cantonensis]TCJ15510.1 cation transporter [Parasulfuritortus cantonensis]